MIDYFKLCGIIILYSYVQRYAAAKNGSSDEIGESWRQKILAQPKVLEAAEYFVYFPLSELHGWGKRFADSRRRFIQRFQKLRSKK